MMFLAGWIRDGSKCVVSGASGATRVFLEFKRSGQGRAKLPKMAQDTHSCLSVTEEAGLRSHQ
jgi:hypothetical protein